MKLYGKVTRISQLIDIPAKEGKEPIQKQILCIEEINEDKEILDRMAIDFLGEKIKLLEGIKVGMVIWINFQMTYNAYDDNTHIFNSLRGWKINIDPSKFFPSEDLPKKEEEEDIPF